MHVRASSLDIFAAACTFDGTDTAAGRVLTHAVTHDDTVITTIKRAMGKLYGPWAGNHTRRDGRWLMFDFPDGSVLAYAPDRRDVWAWAVECRTAAEIVLSCQSGDLLPIRAGSPVRSFDAACVRA